MSSQENRAPYHGIQSLGFGKRLMIIDDADASDCKGQIVLLFEHFHLVKI
ncbi:hypothetical protein AGABI1DRAFT_134867 [Agaricus bisporus var. burnettii JB137-S8]|uniref:Uncharacterized protein n=1 Tax=Agaricus bisporus var. burnettii (strain JB137-S8 / ATCC MYA-4627 / FGSC 10392) TaxID=597362 RepID=K5WS72_AGABU|nr:uncharacterized protein AGABI1DRAFT_134867 [Agaricus bisporus var. burnettii JB137-S8]EKM73392.1 hypothetical protein AGABI1DRAFT_134867 [Agaricus bisporus var. burnettii JB137-S8]